MRGLWHYFVKPLLSDGGMEDANKWIFPRIATDGMSIIKKENCE